jgi:hypothetical protein
MEVGSGAPMTVCKSLRPEKGAPAGIPEGKVPVPVSAFGSTGAPGPAFGSTAAGGGEGGGGGG